MAARITAITGPPKANPTMPPVTAAAFSMLDLSKGTKSVFLEGSSLNRRGVDLENLAANRVGATLKPDAALTKTTRSIIAKQRILEFGSDNWCLLQWQDLLRYFGAIGNCCSQAYTSFSWISRDLGDRWSPEDVVPLFQVLHVFSIACPIFRLFRFLRRIFNTFPISVFQSAIIALSFPFSHENFTIFLRNSAPDFLFFHESSHSVIFGRWKIEYVHLYLLKYTWSDVGV